jgi:hypothetical protein
MEAEQPPAMRTDDTRSAAPLHSVTQANPWHGCSAFVREIGADDEPRPPAGFCGSPPNASG